ncbi:galactose mutarotase-like protein [Meredithblackwellia eburnea MCA 4105]
MPIHTSPTSVTLSLSNGDSAAIAFQGATVHSYISNGVERLFTSTKSDLDGPAAIRGGIPVCWPIFGPPDKDDERFNKMKQHGFARTSKWDYNAAASGEEGDGVKAVFTLTETQSTQSLYSPHFHLTYTVLLTPLSLLVSLKVTSPSIQPPTTPLVFQALLHAYLRLPSTVHPTGVSVSPSSALKGLSYADKVQGGTKFTEERETVVVDGPKGEVDRVYYGAPNQLGLAWDKGGVKVTKKGLADVVLWNPGDEKAASIGDMEEGGASRYVCLEPGQVGSYVQLEAGGEWEASVEISGV